LVTGLGAGHLPWMPGTWGSLEAILLVLGVHFFFPALEWIVLGSLVIFLILVAFLFSGQIIKPETDPDPSSVVIDEILGQIIYFLWVPVSIISLLVGFLLFRIFDVVKPFPVRNCEKIPGMTGVILDDVVASCYAVVVTRALMWLVSQ